MKQWRLFLKSSPLFQRRWVLLAGVLLLAVLGAGWAVTNYFGNQARRGIIDEGETSVSMLSVYITSELKKFEGAVRSLSGSPYLMPALLSRTPSAMEHANSALDRYNYALDATVSYVMDAGGITVASSNRNESDSFVGRSYRFRPYFVNALKGKPDRYFGLGVTSEKRGFYASHPVRGPKGGIIGVAVIKKDIDETETLFRQYPNCFFVNPAGIVFLSSRPELLFRSLWPVSDETRRELTASQQFGRHSFDALHSKEMADGDSIRLEGKHYLVFRKMIGRDGWSVVYLASTERIRIYRMIGIMSTLSLCLLISIFLAIIHFTEKSKEAIQQSERRYRKLFNSANDAILIMKDGRFADCNDLTLKMFGCTREQIIGSPPEAFSPPVQPDGQNSMGKALEKINRAVAGEPQFFEWKHRRRDGTLFDAEVSLGSIQVDEEVLVQAFVRDITERKRMEAEIAALTITDHLTGLYNRRGFLTLAEQQLKIAERNRGGLLLLFADLDDMKWINDNLGHEKGDKALVETASILREVFRQSDIIARIGGDEFAVLAVGYTPGSSGRIEERLQSLIDSRNAVRERDYHISLSVGVALTDPENPKSIDALMSRADQAMYEEKRRKKGKA